MDNKPSTTSLARSITHAEQTSFSQDGVVLLKNVYPQEWVAYLRTQLMDIFDRHEERTKHADGISKGVSQDGASSDMVPMVKHVQSKGMSDLAIEGDHTLPLSGRSIVETDASRWHAGMREHNVSGPAPQLIHELTQSNEVIFYSDQLFHKGPGSRIKTPFHQDKPYFLIDGGDVAVAWIPVDVVTKENGAMGYVKGSHQWGKLYKPSDFVTETGTMPQNNGLRHDDLEQLDLEKINPADIVYFDAEPGDVIVHHWSTLHGSTGNTSATSPRSAASIRYALDGCHYYKRPSSPEPFRHTVDLQDGDPLTKADRFPQVWPRS